MIYYAVSSIRASLKGKHPMKIVINALQYKPDSSGIGVMLRDLFGPFTRITERPCQVILPHDGPEFPAGEETELICSPWEHRQGFRRMFFQTFQMGRRYCRDAVLLTTDSKTPFFLSKSCTLVPLVTDLAVYRMPEAYQFSRVLWWRLQYRYIRRRAGFFLAISEFTRSEMTKILKIPPEKIHVVPCACSGRMTRVEDPGQLDRPRERYGLPEQFILFVGNTNPRKNLERTIQAFDVLKERTSLPHQLVIAGGQGWKFDRDKALKNIRHRDAVRFTGFVPDEDMPALYSAASLFVFPTLYEGFGIPVLEAQACGVPVVTSNRTSLPEVAGEGAEYVDPYDVESICAGMRKILEDPGLAWELVERGYFNVRRFSWEESAGRLNEIIEREVNP